MTDVTPFELPADLTLLSDADIATLETTAVTEFDRVRGIEEVTPATVQYQMQLTDNIDSIRADIAGRNARAQEAATRAQASLVDQQAHLEARVHGPTQAEVAEAAQTQTGVDVEAIAAAATRGATAALFAVMGDKGRSRLGGDLAQVTERATASLSAAQRVAPPAVTASANRLAVTAGVDIPGVARNQEMTSLSDVVGAFQKTARSIPATRDGTGREVLVAQIRNEYEHTVDDRTPPAQIEELFRHLTTKANQEALVAGGGWCAPSQIRYDFFNIACQDGLVDLPTFGVTRGGIRFPTSPSLADAVYQVGASANQNLAGFGTTFSSASMPWVWTETDDIATVTGSPNKPTMRVPCPGFNEARLECYGITMTAGNLTDDAYPEATANTLRLLNSAWSHAQNARIIGQMVTLSTAAIAITGGGATRPAYNQILSGLDLAATDYRAKFAMCDADVLEVIAPFWVADVITADLAWRTNVEMLSVTQAQINGWFADRNLRVQWVNDWQVRTSGLFGFPSANMTLWPTQADFLVYAAGTFIKGNGLTLDLGVVRDSVLNAENDFTAAWAEECHLVAKVGHESRRYTISFTVNGAASGAVALGANI
jgi:hypothetical protein